ncbi:MAG: YihY/virulence factor BrkB family protein [Erythrobacter sp.]
MGVPAGLSDPAKREIRSLSPEARRLAALEAHRTSDAAGVLRNHMLERLGPGTRIFQVVKRTAIGTWNDGFIHAGNLAYLSMLAIFPFFILGAAFFELVGETGERAALVDTVMGALPPIVSQTIAPVASDTMGARADWLLWLGAIVALWTVSSLVETIRDILRRAYGTKSLHAFWKYRLLSAGLIIAAVVLLIVSLFAQVAIGAAQQVIDARFPQLTEWIDALRYSRIVPTIGLFGSIYLLFYTLTPAQYRTRDYPKWPGALFTATWWLAATSAVPPILRGFLTYNLAYGSLAGIIIVLFFFWLVGLGLVIGAELNAALAEPVRKSQDDTNTNEDLSQEDAG